VVHRTSTVGCPVCHPRVLCFSARAGAHLMRCRRPLARSSRCSAGSPDSPVNYSGANSRSWRVPESLSPGAPDTVRCTPDSPVNYSGAPLDFSEGDEFGLESPGAPDTVRCHTGLSGAPDQGCLRLSLALFVEPNSWSFYWLNVNLWHLYNLYTRAN
jgi:hypothetical protein